MKFDRMKLNNEQLVDLYKNLLLPRMIEEKMLILLRQGKISKWFSGYGQEAISVGATRAMNSGEYILPMHRNLGVFTSRNIDLGRLFSQFQGKHNGFTQGHDRSFHFGVKELNIVGMISHLGPQLGIADGIALANKLAQKEQATLVFTGDGASSEGDFHEALNVAAVWDLPVVFVIENNGYGLSTPSKEQFRCKYFVDKAIGYGMEAMQCDGNNILDVYHTISEASDKARKNKKPIMVEALTFRIRGHEEASGTKYYPDGLIEKWSEKDPVLNFEKYLLDSKVIDENIVTMAKEEFKQAINQGLDFALNDEPAEVSEQIEYARLFKSVDVKPTKAEATTKAMRFIDAIHNGLDLALEKHSNLIFMGQDIADYGGVFKATEGLSEKYGKARVRNTPLCESAIIGSALGLSIEGYKAMVEMQFADFVTCGFNQIVNNLAKINWRWGQNADVVVRMPTGAGVAAGPFHSQSNEAWFFHTPGLKILYPSCPAEAKGLLLAAFEDPNPVLFFEHKAMYRSLSEEVPESYYTLPIGKANVVKEGTKASVITYGMGVEWAKELGEKESFDQVEIIDLRSLSPIDYPTIFESVKKTNRVLLLHEDCLTGGIGGELSARITENCFEFLDAPILRVGSLDTPVPFAANLEDQFLAKARFEKTLSKLLQY